MGFFAQYGFQHFLFILLNRPPVTITAPPTISSTSIADNDAVQHDIPVTRESQPQPSSIKLFDNIKNIANTH